MSTANFQLSTPSPAREKQRRRFLLFLPLVVVPFLCFVFYALGGGKGGAGATKAPVKQMGFNLELPKALFNPRQALTNKLAFYEKAERDSARKNEFRRMDPYTSPARARADSVQKEAPLKNTPGIDGRASALLEQLGRLQQSLPSSKAVTRPLTPPPVLTTQPRSAVPVGQNAPAGGGDPQMDRLNAMLDKVIWIQHPNEKRAEAPEAVVGEAAEVAPADSTTNTIPAVVAQRQTLTNGSTIALRLTDSIRVRGQVIPPGQLVYGVANINNDRLQVRISAVYHDRNLFPADLQVYDLDGLAGIHMPGAIGRDVAKQSADQGVSGLNIIPVDPSLGAQAASAGVQTAKSFFSRKVRLVRVTVPAGYAVLLRQARAFVPHPKSVLSRVFVVRPPGFVPGGHFLHHAETEGVEVGLEGIYLKDGVLWVALGWRNRSAIPYQPEYARWFIRDRRVVRRTAMQEVALEPLQRDSLPVVGSDSIYHRWTALRPVAPGNGKELVLAVGEKGGGRSLELVISNAEILKAKKL